MNKTIVVAFLLTAALGACTVAQPSPTASPSPARPSATPPPSATAPATPTEETVKVLKGQPLSTEKGKWFTGSGGCVVCHSQMADESGADVSIDGFWRATLMANSARDPYWQASVRAEVQRAPELRAVIEDACATCHMPMARTTAKLAGGQAQVLDAGNLDPSNPLYGLAMDGVSCSLCHQITGGSLGPNGTSGKFGIDTALPEGQRQIYGPYEIAPEQAAIMQAASGYVPFQGMHLAQSEMCATCHTLYTSFLDSAGNVAGTFPEQVPYLEWYYSSFRNTTNCQGCHMPEAKGGVKIASSSTDLRSPFAQHSFAGGNAYMLKVLEAFGEELGVTASGGQLEASYARDLDMLQGKTAAVSLENLALSGSRVTGEVVVRNQAGHKFPTSFPSRRAWLHIAVKDAAGQVVFESGAVNPDGSIVGNDNDQDPAKVEPHYTTLTQADQVQIYEAILQDSDGRVTTSVMRAAAYLKDNRLLPAGFEKAAPYPDIAVRGAAMEDPDFLGGGDRLGLSLDVGAAQGPFSVSVELLYQPLSYRWTENLRQQEGPEITRFLGYVQAIPDQPVVVASSQGQVP